MSIAPLAITMAIHYYTTPGPYSPDDLNHANSPAVCQFHKWMCDAGLLRPIPKNQYGALYEATEACQVYVRALSDVPFPVQKWVIPES